MENAQNKLSKGKRQGLLIARAAGFRDVAHMIQSKRKQAERRAVARDTEDRRAKDSAAIAAWIARFDAIRNQGK